MEWRRKGGWLVRAERSDFPNFLCVFSLFACISFTHDTTMIKLRALWLAVILPLLVIGTVASTKTEEATSDAQAQAQHSRRSSYLTRFISKPHVNLLPLASLLGLTTSPLGVTSMHQGLGSSDVEIGAAARWGNYAREELTLLTFNV